jgi:hypothetical protein
VSSGLSGAVPERIDLEPAQFALSQLLGSPTAIKEVRASGDMIWFLGYSDTARNYWIVGTDTFGKLRSNISLPAGKNAHGLAPTSRGIATAWVTSG